MLLERIKANNEERRLIQEELNHISGYYDLSYSEMYQYYRVMKQKSAEKFISLNVFSVSETVNAVGSAPP